MSMTLPNLLLPAAATVNAAQLAYAAFQAQEELARQSAIVKARKYHDGMQGALLNNRLRQFLNLDTKSPEFRLNVTRQVVTAVTERLLVGGFSVPGADAIEKGKKINPQAQWAWELWQANRMDAKMDEVHEGALRDGEYFIIVDWDGLKHQPRFTPHERYCDPSVGGDGEGCRMFYENNDPNQAALYAVKRWTENFSQGKARQRMTIFYPDRIEKYRMDGSRWIQVTDAPEEQWPVPWLGSDNLPLGIPVIHFKNKSLQCEAWDAIPLQDAINKTLIDLIGAADLTAFRILFAFGWIPTTDGKDPKDDGSNLLQIAPGQMISTTKSKNDAGIDVVDPAELGGLIEVTQSLILWLAGVTDTPASRFQMTRQISAEGTLKQQMEPLLAKTRNRQALVGNGWEDCMAVARRIWNRFGKSEQALDEQPRFITQWTSAQTRDIADRVAEMKGKQETGVPEEQLWREWGYTEEEIETFNQSDQVLAKKSLMKAGLDAAAG